MDNNNKRLSMEFWCSLSRDEKLMYIKLMEVYGMICLNINNITEEEIELIWTIKNT